MEAEQLSGMVRYYNESRGFGFLLYDEIKEIFFHISSVEDLEIRPLTHGDKVLFTVAERNGKPIARDIKRYDNENS